MHARSILLECSVARKDPDVPLDRLYSRSAEALGDGKDSVAQQLLDQRRRAGHKTYDAAEAAGGEVRENMDRVDGVKLKRKKRKKSFWSKS